MYIPLNYNPFIFGYFLVILSYLCIIALLWIENKKLEEFNIDRLTLVLLILFALIRSNYKVPGEVYFKISIFILGLVLLAFFIVNFSNIPKTKPRSILIGVLSCLLVIPLAYVDSFNPAIRSGSIDSIKNLGLSLFQNAQGVLSFVSPYEELIYRSILWGQLLRHGWTNNRILIFQAILFWLLHFWQVFTTPFTFLTILPITILVASLLIYSSKQIFPSILFHTACDTLVATIARLIIR